MHCILHGVYSCVFSCIPASIVVSVCYIPCIPVCQHSISQYVHISACTALAMLIATQGLLVLYQENNTVEQCYFFCGFPIVCLHGGLNQGLNFCYYITHKTSKINENFSLRLYSMFCVDSKWPVKLLFWMIPDQLIKRDQVLRGNSVYF